MKSLGIDKPILILLFLIIVQIVCSGVCALTGIWQQRTALLTTQIFPLLVALPGLWKFKYWAWLVALVVTFYSLTGLFSVIVNWGANIAYYQRFDTNFIKVAYMLVVSYVIDFAILILLIVERGYFDE